MRIVLKFIEEIEIQIIQDIIMKMKYDIFWIAFAFFSAYGIGVFNYIQRTNGGERNPFFDKTSNFEKLCMIISIVFIITLIYKLIIYIL